MAKAHALVVHKLLISWIISKNTRLQVVFVITAIIAVFANVFPLEMQRRKWIDRMHEIHEKLK